MSNLLPEKNLQKIHREYQERFLLTASSLAIVAAVFATLVLSPSLGVLYSSRPETQARASQLQQSREDSTSIAHSQMLLSQLAPVSVASSSATNAILSALSARPSGVRIDNVVYNPGSAGTPSTLALGGIEDSRANVDKYRTLLEANTLFSSVKLPVGDLLATQGARFTITITGNF